MLSHQGVGLTLGAAAGAGVQTPLVRTGDPGTHPGESGEEAGSRAAAVARHPSWKGGGGGSMGNGQQRSGGLGQRRGSLAAAATHVHSLRNARGHILQNNTQSDL